MTIRILEGDCRAILPTLPDASVQCVVTSPPYFGLRDYGTAQWEGGDATCDHIAPFTPRSERPGGIGRIASGGPSNDAQDYGAHAYRDTCGKCGARRIDQQIGLESSVDAYVAALVAVFREVKRVLRDDGTLWLNLGDTYNNRTKIRTTSHQPSLNEFEDVAWRENRENGGGFRMSDAGSCIKEKDLIGVPWRVAFALQADGWWLRSAITWCKRAPMPESVTDRPTSATEMIFLLAKSARYFYDAMAVAEPSVSDHGSGNGYARQARLSYDGRGSEQAWEPQPTRNMRNYWLLGPEPFPDAHFAVFPTAIPRRAILAGTSERGSCPACGAPWERVVERDGPSKDVNGGRNEFGWPQTSGGQNVQTVAGLHRHGGGVYSTAKVLGWQASCACDAGAPVPCVVLDPFGGAGTTGLVADRLGRDAVLIELNPAYASMARERIRGDAPLFASVE